MLKPGIEVRAQAFIKAEDPTGETTIQVGFFDAAGNEIGERTASRNAGRRTSDWTKTFVRADVPEGTVYAKIFLSSADNSGTVWFDDITLTIEEE